MAIDPRISLGVQSVQLNDPLETVGKAVALQNALANGKAQQQRQAIDQEQLRGLKTKNDETDRSLADERNLEGIWNEAGGDWSKTRDLAVARGINPRVVTQIDKNIADHAANVAKQSESDIKLARDKNAFAYDALSSAAALENDPTAQKAEYDAKVQEGISKGLFKPAEVVPYQGPQSVRQMRNKFATEKNILDQADELRKAQKATQETAAAARAVDTGAVDLAKKNADLSKTYMEQAGVLPDTPALAETKRHNRIEEGISSTRESREQQALNLRTKGSLGVLSDSQKSIAQKVAEGDLSVEQLSRLPDKEAIIAGALELNPEWTRNTFATKRAFTDPASKQSQNLGTISRIVGHIGRFEKNSEDLGVSPSMLIGKSLSGGAAAVANDAHAIAGELEKLVSGGVGSVGQIKAWQEELKSSRPGIRKAAIDEISQLIGSQYEGMQQTYKAGTGKDLPVEKYVSPEGRKWMADKGIAGVKSAVGVGDPLGIRPK